MIPFSQERLENFCHDLSESIEANFPYLTTYFLLFEEGEKKDKISHLLNKLSTHPALDDAAALLRFKTTEKESASFLGVVDSYQKIYLGLKTERKSLAFITLNISRCSSYEDAVFLIYFCCSQLLDSLKINKEIMGEEKANKSLHAPITQLTAEIFAVLQMVKDGHYDYPQRHARKRCIETLTPQSSHSPCNNPYPIALDVIHYAIENQMLNSILARGITDPLIAQHQVAHHIANNFNDDSFAVWSHFADCSQIMAWTGFSASQILGAAVNTSTDPFIKATGHLLAELTNLSPVDAEHLPHGYNPFVDYQINQINHDRVVDEMFEMGLIHAMEAGSGHPLIHIANNQNNGLMKGKTLGWCAHALQSAGKAFDNASSRGIPPIQAARLEFQSAKNQLSWRVLHTIAEYILDHFRKGETISARKIMEHCEAHPDAKNIAQSLEESMKIQHATEHEVFIHPVYAAEKLALQEKPDFLLDDTTR